MDDQLTEDVFDLEADVVVVGSGMAGCVAAVTAAARGASVLVLERGAALGGTTALSGGGTWIPNNSQMRAEGVEDPKGPAMQYMAKLSYPHLYDAEDPQLGLPEDAYALIETFYDKGASAVDRLVELGAAEVYADLELPDYYAELAENAAPYGRKISPTERKLGAELGGPALIARMSKVAHEHGARFLLEHRAARILRNPMGEVVGLEARTGRRTVLVRSRRAVVFASGGFLHDRDLTREFLRGPVFGGCAVPEATGDFVRLGTEVGAQLGNMGHAWWYQVALEHAVGTGKTAGGFFMPFGDSMIQVNRHGRRVVDEKAPYNERGQVHFAWDGNDYCNLVLLCIYDDAVANNPDPIGYRFPIPPPGERPRYVVSGDTFEDLASNVAERLRDLRAHTGGLELGPHFLRNLRETIERFNGFAVTGVDEDFGRGSHAISHLWGGRCRPEARGTMHPFAETGPYHCILVVAGALDTKGGPRINTRSQVLDTAGDPIPGLYGAGNCVASPAGQAYWGPGGTLGPALVFGWIAGEEAATEPEKVLSP
jgi:3-oxosteroid 1-dehydrogenase